MDDTSKQKEDVESKVYQEICLRSACPGYSERFFSTYEDLGLTRTRGYVISI